MKGVFNVNITLIYHAIETELQLQIHLVNGETYVGFCRESDSSSYFTIRTKSGLFSFPSWAIKRIKEVLDPIKNQRVPYGLCMYPLNSYLS